MAVYVEQNADNYQKSAHYKMFFIFLDRARKHLNEIQCIDHFSGLDIKT